MINRLEIKNFKCLRDTQLHLGAFNVLIGPNDSGKSSILDAIHLLGTLGRYPVAGAKNCIFSGDRTPRTLVWRGDPARSLEWTAEGTMPDGRTFHYHVEVCGTEHLVAAVDAERIAIDGRVELETKRSDKSQPANFTRLYTAWLNGDEPSYAAVGAAIQATSRYRLDPTALRRSSEPEVEPTLSFSGDNLPAVLDALMTGPDRRAVIDLEAALCGAFPTLRGISLRTLRPEDGVTKRALDFVLAGNEAPPIGVPATLTSDGALLLTAFLALAYSRTPGILLVEEPENGLHPSGLERVIGILRKISTGEIGNRPRQVVLTTHSPILLNYVSAEEVRVVRRDRDQATIVTPMTEAPGVHDLLREYGVGELWYLLGEDDLLKGGRP